VLELLKQAIYVLWRNA